MTSMPQEGTRFDDSCWTRVATADVEDEGKFCAEYTCHQTCSTHGHYVNNVCLCEDGWQGRDCTVHLPWLYAFNIKLTYLCCFMVLFDKSSRHSRYPGYMLQQSMSREKNPEKTPEKSLPSLLKPEKGNVV